MWLRKVAQDKEKRETFTNSVLTFIDSPVGQRLYEILDELERELDRPKEADYENPNWAYKQADYNGARRMLQKIKGIIKDDRSI